MMWLKALSKRSWEAAVIELFAKSFMEGQNFIIETVITNRKILVVIGWVLLFAVAFYAGSWIYRL
jgi:hypothetical protein